MLFRSLFLITLIGVNSCTKDISSVGDYSVVITYGKDSKNGLPIQFLSFSLEE